MTKKERTKQDPALKTYLAGDDLLSQLYAEQSTERTPPELDQSVFAAAGNVSQKKPAKTASKNVEKSSGRNAEKKPRAADKNKTTTSKPNWIKRLVIAAAIIIGLALILDLLQDQTLIRAIDTPPSEAAQDDTDQIGIKQIDIDNNSGTATNVPSTDLAASASTADIPEASAQADAKQTNRPEAIAPGSVDNVQDGEPVIPKQEPVQVAPAPEQQAEARETQSAPEPSTPDPSRDLPTSANQQDLEQAQRQQSQRERSPQPSQDLILPDNPSLAGPASQQTPEQAPEYRESPQSWIRHIIFLADTGDTALASSELRALKQKHPNTRLPAELQGLGSR